jgi:pSer/pThr/pTyr-binding forkhead associated (FHA) protein
MRQSSIVLTVSEPHGDKHEFVYTRASRIVVGRGEDCDLHVPADMEHMNVSRHHCQIEIDPPHIRVRDLDSLNGTIVNGEHIGGGWFDPFDTEPYVDANAIDDKELNDGDELVVGPMSIRVHIEEPHDPEPLGLAVVT